MDIDLALRKGTTRPTCTASLGGVPGRTIVAMALSGHAVAAVARRLERGVSRGLRRCAQVAAHFLTVSHVRVVTSLPKVLSINFMKTGPLSLGI
jgi:hypothetical protein